MDSSERLSDPCYIRVMEHEELLVAMVTWQE